MPDKIQDRMPATPDVNQERLEQLRALMPDLFTNDGALNPDELKRLIDPDLVPESERFEFRWFGKANAKRNAFTPTLATLEYDHERSVNPELAAGNAIIEGENLEVLKCLLASYRSRVKCIYIDPPYNKDKDYVYSDVWKVDKKTYWEHIGVTSEGVKIDTNTKADGRFHSNWLNMLYPRLLLARQLLAPAGVIFLSIDDKELHHLRKLCDEVFGEVNLVGVIVWKGATDNNPTQIAVEHEYIVCYARDKEAVAGVWQSKVSDAKEAMLREYARLKKEHTVHTEKIQGAFRMFVRNNSEALVHLTHYTLIDERGPYTGSRKVHNPKPGGYVYDVIHPLTGRVCVPPVNGYRYPEDRLKALIVDGRIIFGEDETQIIQIKKYLDDYQDKLSSVMALDSRAGANELGRVFGNRKLFTNPKPHELLIQVLRFVMDDGEIMLDFFAGSGTTGQAMLELNAQTLGKRKFILVQIPELVDPDSPAYEEGFHRISDITIERNRRVVLKFDEAAAKAEAVANDDLPGITEGEVAPFRAGFKAYRLAKSCFPRTEFVLDPEKSEEENLEVLDAYIREKESAFLMTFDQDDILQEVLLKNGFMLDVQTEHLTDFAENVVFRAGDSHKEAVVCLDDDLKEQTIAKLKGVEGVFICLERALNTTKKWNLRAEFGERLVAF